VIQFTLFRLSYREYKVKEEEKARLKAEKIKRREEKIAKGEELGPEDELEKEPSAMLALLRVFLVFIGIIMALGWLITGSVFWEYDGKWVRLATYLPVRGFFRILQLYRATAHDFISSHM
jgi:hypothetical protein